MNICILMERLCRVNEKYAVTVTFSDSSEKRGRVRKRKSFESFGMYGIISLLQTWCKQGKACAHFEKGRPGRIRLCPSVGLRSADRTGDPLFFTYNFVGDRIDGYEAPIALLTREAARALKTVSNELMVKGFRLKIYDAYRPVTAVKHFILWGIEDEDVRMKPYFYPDLEKQALFKDGYIAKQSSHSRGSTVDLTLLDMRTGKELDMGGPFDLFSEVSHPDYRGITEEQYDNRMFLQNVMLRNGFTGIDCEWWHFTLKDEPYPDTYFTFPVAQDSLRK